MDCNFHPFKAVHTTTKKVIWSCLCEIEHIPATSCNVCYAVFVIAVVVVNLVHLQNTVAGFVESKVFRKQKSK